MGHKEEISARQLLELYFEGGTTLEQEKSLRDYFAGPDVPADMEYARAMFGFFGHAAADTAPGGVFPADLMSRQGGRQADIRTEAVPAAGPQTARRRTRVLYAAVSVAAVFLVAIGITFLIDGRPDDRGFGDEKIYCYVDGEPVTDIEFATRQMQMAARILEGSIKTTAESIRVVSEAGRPIHDLGIIADTEQETTDPGE